MEKYLETIANYMREVKKNYLVKQALLFDQCVR